jgi:hypothetical protein
MLVRHATPRRNLRSILAKGLDPAYSQGARAEVWLHTPGNSTWAVPHVAQRHEVPAESVTVLEWDVPRSWLTRRRGGIWTCDRLVPAERLRRTVTVK